MNNNTKEMRLNDGKLILGSSIDQPSIIMSGDGGSVNIKTDLLTDDRIQQVQDKDGTFAYLDDINQQKTTSYTADNGIYYVNNGIITVTDPVGEANKGYIVHVIGGTSTIGGVSYLPGALIYRYYKAGNWSSKNYDGNDTFVPYTGATQNIDLGEYELKAGQVELDQTPTGTAGVAVTRWNDAIGTSETTLKGGNVILKNGVDLVARVVNKVSPNTTLTKAQYQVVKVSGAQGQRLAVDLARANNDLNSADTLGIVTETIAANQEGFIITVGQLEGINTTGSLQGETWADGDVLYLSPTTAGRITNIKPTGATGHIVILGYVEYAHSVNGKIYVKIMNGWELDELHNVSISSVADKQLLSYDSASSLWKNKSVTTADIAASTNKNYVTDAQQTVIGNTSGTNTGDQDLSTLATKSMSAYSFRVNNTNATANATETTYRANGQQTYTGTITWTGTTAPSGATNHSYNWVQVGNLVTLTITLLYASAGSALNAVNMTLPTDCPNPIKPTGLSGASDILYRGSGKITTSTTATTTQSPVEALLRSNSANNGFELYLQNSASSTMRMAQITITYYTS